MSYIDPDLAVAVIVVWTLLRDFFLAPILVRREIERHAQTIVEQFFVGIAFILKDPAKRASLEAIIAQLVPAMKKAALGGMGKVPSIKEMITLGLAQKFGLIPKNLGGGPDSGPDSGPEEGPDSGPKTAKKGLFGR